MSIINDAKDLAEMRAQKERNTYNLGVNDAHTAVAAELARREAALRAATDNAYNRVYDEEYPSIIEDLSNGISQRWNQFKNYMATPPEDPDNDPIVKFFTGEKPAQPVSNPALDAEIRSILNKRQGVK